MPVTGFEAFAQGLQAEFATVDPATVYRLARLYGTVARDILDQPDGAEGLGRHFGAGIHEAELRHLIAREWVTQADDVLYRRTKLALRLTGPERDALSEWITQELLRPEIPDQTRG